MAEKTRNVNMLRMRLIKTKLSHQRIFCFCMLAVLTGCANNEHRVIQNSQPTWFSNLPIHPGQLIGYGEGASRSVALDQARGDLSRQIRVKITSEQNIIIRDDSGKVSRKTTLKTRSQSQQLFKQLKPLKQRQTLTGYHYVALLLDLRPLEQKIAESLRASWQNQIPKTIKWFGPSALINSELISTLTKRLTHPEQGVDKRQSNVALLRQQGQWLLNIDNINQMLDNQDLSRIIHFENNHNKNFQLKIVTSDKKTDNRLNSGDNFYLELSSNRNTGYYSLFNLYSDGRVNLLAENETLGKSQSYPKKKLLQEGYRLVAEPLESQTVTEDIYVAVLTDRAVDTFDFQQSNAQLVQGKKAYTLHYFLDWLDKTQPKAMSLVKVEVQP